MSIKNLFLKLSRFKNYILRVFKILNKIDSKSLLKLSILYLFLGVAPSLSILSTQNLINSIELYNNQGLSYIIIPFFSYILINIITSIISQKIGYIEGSIKIHLNYGIQASILSVSEKMEIKDFENSEIYNKLERAKDSDPNSLFSSYIYIFQIISQLITLVTSSMILLSWKKWIIIPIFIISIISSICMMKIGKNQYNIYLKRTEDSRKLWYYNHILTNDSTYKEIKLYDLYKYFFEKFKLISSKFIKQDQKLHKINHIVSMIFIMLDQVIGAVICFIIIKSAIIGEILIGSTVSYIKCISTIQSGIGNLLNIIVILYKDSLYIGQLFEFLDIKTHENNVPLESPLETLNSIESIEFKNVSFKYPSRSRNSLNNISFKLEKGDRIAIVGVNGSGKTTIIKLLCGFYKDYGGNILINNIDIRKLDKKLFRKKIATIFQDYNKYDLSFKENIYLGNIESPKDDESIERLIKSLKTEDIYKCLNNGIDTQLGVLFDEGVQISGGQWQKVALMRAFYRNADCYILDEPNSALDPISEDLIFKNIVTITNNKIGILVTHKIINVNKFASKIIVVDNGEILELGTHNELINKRGYYYKLYEAQVSELNKECKETLSYV